MDNNKNKQLLWKLLYEKDYFSKFKNSQFNEIKELFDTLIIEFDQKNNYTLLEKNKQFIQQFIIELNNIKPPYKREDIIDTRKKELFDNYTKKKAEFNEFKQARPPEINFADTIEETPINLLENVSQLNQERKMDTPILQEILNSLNIINNNQEQILKQLSNLTNNNHDDNHDDNHDNDDNNIQNLIVHESDLINIDIND